MTRSKTIWHKEEKEITMDLNNFSVQVRDVKSGRLIPFEEAQLTKGFVLPEGSVISVRSYVRVKNWPNVKIQIPARFPKCNECVSEIKHENESGVGFLFSITTSGSVAKDVFELHEQVYAILVPTYNIIVGKPVLKSDSKLVNLIASVLTKLIKNKVVFINIE